MPGVIQRRALFLGSATRCASTSAAVPLHWEEPPLHASERDPRDARAPMLFLHGLLGSSANWRGVSKRLWQMSPIRPVLVDLRNHGRSPHHEEMTYAAMADDVLSLMDRLRIDSAHLLGHSMGGKTAMRLAMLAPDRVQSLVVVDVAPVRYDTFQDFERYFEAMLSMPLERMQSFQECEAWLAQTVHEPLIRQFLLTNLLRSKSDGSSHSGSAPATPFHWRVPLTRLRRAVEEVRLYDMSDLDGQSYYGRTLMIHGALSHYVDESMKPRILDFFPMAEFRSVADAGHWVHYSNPTQFLTDVSEFLNRA